MWALLLNFILTPSSCLGTLIVNFPLILRYHKPLILSLSKLRWLKRLLLRAHWKVLPCIHKALRTQLKRVLLLLRILRVIVLMGGSVVWVIALVGERGAVGGLRVEGQGLVARLLGGQWLTLGSSVRASKLPSYWGGLNCNEVVRICFNLRLLQHFKSIRRLSILVLSELLLVKLLWLGCFLLIMTVCCSWHSLPILLLL